MNLGINYKFGYWYINILFLRLIVHAVIANDCQQYPASCIFKIKGEKEGLWMYECATLYHSQIHLWQRWQILDQGWRLSYDKLCGVPSKYQIKSAVKGFDSVFVSPLDHLYENLYFPAVWHWREWLRCFSVHSVMRQGPCGSYNVKRHLKCVGENKWNNQVVYIKI